MHFVLHKAKKRLQAIILRVSDWAIFIGLVLIGGLGSSYYMLSAGSSLTTRTIGPWSTWKHEGRSDADPYTRAHFARTGTLNLTTEVANTYLTNQDSNGAFLHSSCEYSISGKQLDAQWWSITAMNDRGQLIANPSKRYTFTSDTVAISPDGTFTVTLARDARPGNWLPTAGAGRLALSLTLLESESAIAGDAEGEATPISLPEIKQVACR
ncbi:MAG: DUF1214 domain-containing protein [Alphaproteobacteria bacterium]|nr:DUF1214 domain-containing protein [Alphaproteobacteria bacterium]